MNESSTDTRPLPTALDLELANLMYRALAAVPEAGRFGSRKVFIAALWAVMRRMDADAVERLAGGELAHFKRWLFRAQRLMREGHHANPPLVVLARADLVAAMPYMLVADSETVADGASFHFVLDPITAPDAYASRAASDPRCPDERRHRQGGRS